MSMTLNGWKLGISAIGLCLAVVGAVITYLSFLRSERWKKAEFLASAMKEIFADARVQKALTMIDWGLRPVKLLDQAENNDGTVIVSRSMQSRALWPHVLLQSDNDVPGEGRFTLEEAAIRDHYDAFLDRLQQLSHYVETRLINVEDLRPYLGYWVDTIFEKCENDADKEWKAVLFVYIEFYRFDGVQKLFGILGKPIDRNSFAFKDALEGVSDRNLSRRLTDAIKSH